MMGYLTTKPTCNEQKYKAVTKYGPDGELNGDVNKYLDENKFCSDCRQGEMR
jgi:hypothetical protein